MIVKNMHIRVHVFEYVVKGNRPSICSNFFKRIPVFSSMYLDLVLLRGISLDLGYVHDDQ